jgi:hypothetical protein
MLFVLVSVVLFVRPSSEPGIRKEYSLEGRPKTIQQNISTFTQIKFAFNFSKGLAMPSAGAGQAVGADYRKDEYPPSTYSSRWQSMPTAVIKNSFANVGACSMADNQICKSYGSVRPETVTHSNRRRAILE